MSQNVPEKKKRKSNANKFRNQNILLEAAKGKTQSQIAEKYDLSRKQVERILNSDEVKQIVRQGESRIVSMVDKALLVIERALDSSDEKVAVDTAIRVAKSAGVMKDKVDVTHSMAKPTVIHKRDGSTVILGMSEEDGE